ncbi:MAG: hypothetical protein IJA75_09060, partial [Oscillospiraceae bacterium]|nr:hypothetical protein [Oscillospiraceae bacterium]
VQTIKKAGLLRKWLLLEEKLAKIGTSEPILTDVVCGKMFPFILYFRRIRNIFHHIRHHLSTLVTPSA